MQDFEAQIELPHSAADVFRWHAQPGAFVRLAPPWRRIALASPAASLVDGSQQTMTLCVGPLRIHWQAEIRHVTPDREFTDVQLAGPFKHWEHRHIVAAHIESSCTLEDRVSFALPLGRFGELVAGRLVRRELRRLFAYRHALTFGDLQRHSRVNNTQKKTVLVTGSSGLVGSALTSFLTTGGHTVRRLVRREPKSADEFRWDPAAGKLDGNAVEGVDAVVHLAGEGIASGRWTKSQKERITKSRVEGTSLVVDAIRGAKEKPKTLLCASAIGWYGPRGDEEITEESETGGGFLSKVCRDWEAQSRRVDDVRVARMRFGVILSPAGGALKKMLLPFKLGAGGRLGTGKQWMSWIALDDVVGAIHHVLFNEELNGVINFVAPNAVTNEEFTRVLAKVLGRPAFLPAPAFAVRLALGEMAEELLLTGQHVFPKKLEESGYEFAHPELEGALRHGLGK